MQNLLFALFRCKSQIYCDIHEVVNSTESKIFANSDSFNFDQRLGDWIFCILDTREIYDSIQNKSAVEDLAICRGETWTVEFVS